MPLVYIISSTKYSAPWPKVILLNLTLQYSGYRVLQYADIWNSTEVKELIHIIIDVSFSMILNIRGKGKLNYFTTREVNPQFLYICKTNNLCKL